MNALEDTKSGSGSVIETLKYFSELGRFCHETINRLEIAQSFSRAEVLALFAELLDTCQSLRDAILTEDSAATWRTKEELHAVASGLAAGATRRRFLDLAQFLAAGTVSHRRERTRQERLALRDQAVVELMEISRRPVPPELPGPAVEQWLQWACSLEDNLNELELLRLKTNFPRLDDFASQLEINWWHSGDQAGQVASRHSIQAAILVAESGFNGSLLIGNEDANASNSIAIQAEEEVEQFVQTSTAVIEEEPSVEVASDHAEEAHIDLNTALASLFPVDEDREVELEMLSPIENRKLSFFPWLEVEQFTRHIEMAKVERKEARSVRVLLAISHWLEPREHTPLSHPKCGIRALTGHAEGADFDWASPSDVMREITLNDGLPLLTGGVDLLRWGLLQPSGHNFVRIVSIRRFTKEHVKAWFNEVYPIALSDTQIEDICRLTSGIPLLVGELNKLIITSPDDPPTWLGHDRWTEIKSMFEQQIPVIAQELKKGSPAVRLTDCEISMLKTVVKVSSDPMPETIVEDLPESRKRYQHPEYDAFIGRDEAILALLLELGLLPMHNVTAAVPSKALVPVKCDDAICKIIGLL